ncbi:MULTISPECIES: hypothetical protein [Protofrankia]|uniref:hypothetical protein n=1 Tax=Protofrankia TaxID=2994361 RepID=UPI00104147A2|nr:MULTISPECIES: hypothetical protein [Protofrankia]
MRLRPGYRSLVGALVPVARALTHDLRGDDTDEPEHLSPRLQIRNVDFFSPVEEDPAVGDFDVPGGAVLDEQRPDAG